MTALSYSTYITSIKDSLKSVIDGTTSFNGKVSADAVNEETSTLSARIELTSDEVLGDGGPGIVHHNTGFTVKVRYLSGVDEDDLDALVGYVGEIVNAIEADRTLGNSYILNTEVTQTEYSVQVADPGAPLIMRHCHISVEVEGLRNTN